MNTLNLNTKQTSVVDNKSRTLQALFEVICADNEFALLRHTLALYCEEIAQSDVELN